jgi:hypothetical protein
VEGTYDLGPLFEEAPSTQGTPARTQQDGAPLATDAERQRLTAHAPPYPMRFHYRFTAAALAEEAAALVPPRSHAYATLLCHAARFSADEPARVQSLWFTYVKNGAFISGMTFGQDCPEPDFERLRNPKPRSSKLAMPQRTWRLRTLAMVGGGLLLPVMGAALFFRRKRRETEEQIQE